MFWHNEEFASGFGKDIALDGVICVVDAVFGMQVTCSSIVLNDLLDILPYSKCKKIKLEMLLVKACGRPRNQPSYAVMLTQK